MRKLLLAILLLIPIVSAQQIHLDVAVTKVEPFPAAPGQQVDVWVRITNNGETTPDFALMLKPEYPFTIAPGQSETVHLGPVPHNEESIIKYRVAVDAQAIGEDKNITFRYSAYPTDQQYWVELEYPISIRTRDALAVIDSYRIEPLKPGASAALTLSINNQGKELLRNVDISLDLSNLPLSTADKGTKQRAGTMEPGQSSVLSFAVMADPAASLKAYHVPVKFTFQDSSGRNYTEETSISIPVDAVPEVQAGIDSTTIRKGTAGTVTFRIINKGVPDIKFVSVSLKQDPSFAIVSPSSEMYIGNLDSDDFETVELELEPKAETLHLPLDITFKDAYNKDYTKSYTLGLGLRDPEKKTSYFLYLPWLVIVLIMAYWFWKRRK